MSNDNKNYIPNLRKALSDKIIERFSAHATIKAIEENISGLAKQSIMDKYKDKILINDGLEFKLHSVYADTSSSSYTLELPKVNLYLHYFCESKLPKDKREKVEEVKSNSKGGRYVPYCNYKIPLWHTLRYEIDCERILSGNIRLSIEINETND